jgi:hypothetical protein
MQRTPEAILAFGARYRKMPESRWKPARRKKPRMEMRGPETFAQRNLAVCCLVDAWIMAQKTKCNGEVSLRD